MIPPHLRHGENWILPYGFGIFNYCSMTDMTSQIMRDASIIPIQIFNINDLTKRKIGMRPIGQGLSHNQVHTQWKQKR